MSVALAVLIAAALMAGTGVYLSRTTSAARSETLADFGARAEIIAGAVGGTLAGSDEQTRAVAESTYAGTAAELAAQRGTVALTAAWYAVLRPDGELIVSEPVAQTPTARSLVADPGFEIANRSGTLAFGDVVDTGGVPSVVAYQPFRGVDGPRVLAEPVPLSQVGVLFSRVIGIPTGDSYVLDGTGRIIAASNGAAAGSRLTDPALAAAVTAKAAGTVGGTYFASRQVSGSRWRAVTAAPRAALLAPVQATERVAWQLFAAFCAALALILVIGCTALVSAARLARARLHDALTGLPNRALFMERAEGTIADRRRNRGPNGEGIVAALFLDLDGFKPVNDTYGHAAGDALLKQVAQRLTDATRPDDFVSRFGGDEFLVLCRGIRSVEDAQAVADRIQQYLTEPFDLDGRAVTIGVSIGIATLTDDTQEAETLIQRADLALYRAKENGRGRVEVFTGT
ncbi:hypothetical protein Val02_45090 [Virgisporangium aliadipatigenens]|uniref:GGDEF domain-containing protein n=1 Tax=Virgisporangium aliadipatigenens TaxID=741659 RepID=A0A8J4DS93_9ACTN|nr:GGDEF domain-containing protein [Virgisporangium aliadipatigenens]GIJ47623.1 hypothetical protein Val02_45090 [Virgisporangium aliadipatigenens]